MQISFGKNRSPEEIERENALNKKK